MGIKRPPPPLNLLMGSALSLREPSSSGSVVSDYGLDYRAIEVRFPAEAKGVFL
jgi:hypothetical protein